MPRRTCEPPPADPLFLERYAPRLLEFVCTSREYAIMLVDADRTVHWGNEGCCHILGVDNLQEISGVLLDRFFLEADVEIGIPAHEIDVAASVGFSTDDRWMSRWDGSRFWAKGMMIRTDGEPGFVKILRDLTATKMQLDLLANQLRKAEEENLRKSRAVALLSHEIRNPLSAIQLAASLLAKDRPVVAGPGRQHDPLQIIQRNVGVAVQLADDLLEEGREAAGKSALRVEQIELRELLVDAVEVAKARQAQLDRNIDIIFPAGPILLDGDRTRLQQVFVNLVGNAIKYTPSPGQIWVSGTPQTNQVIVEVADQGIGIKPDMLETIFGLFVQAETPLTSEGLGVGLALVKKLVQMHGGSVVAQSEGAGKGSIFKVSLPRRQPGRASGS